jgi:hypothetical protein
MFGLLCVSTSMGRSESTPPANSEVEVYLKGEAASSAEVLAEMNRELAALMQQPSFRVVWRHANDGLAGGGAAHLIVVELRGECAVPSTDDSLQPAVPSMALASTSVVDGKVLPFSWVDCSALSRFLAPALSTVPDAEQAHIYGRSMARLLAHEFYHVLAQTDDHTQVGLSKARFSTADLLAEHFDFEAAALNKLRPPSPVVGGDDPSAAGR